MRTPKLLRLLVLAIGVLYVVLAIAGFTAISDDTTKGGELQGGNPPDLLFGLLSVNTVLNFIHLLLGAVTIGGGAVFDRSRLGAWMATIGFGLLFVYDVVQMFITTGTDPLAINGADTWLHAITLLVLGLMSFVLTARAKRVTHSDGPTAARRATTR